MYKAGGLGGREGEGVRPSGACSHHSLRPYLTEEALALSLLTVTMKMAPLPLSPAQPWDGAPLCRADKWVHSRGELDIRGGCVGGQGSVRHTQDNLQLCRPWDR